MLLGIPYFQNKQRLELPQAVQLVDSEGFALLPATLEPPLRATRSTAIQVLKKHLESPRQASIWTAHNSALAQGDGCRTGFQNHNQLHGLNDPPPHCLSETCAEEVAEP